MNRWVLSLGVCLLYFKDTHDMCIKLNFLIWQIHKRPDEPSDELEELITEPRPSKPAKNYSYNPPQRSNSPPGACATHLSPCYQSPSLRQHPRSTPSTPCPAPSPMAATPHSPAISPAPPQMLKGPESQDKRGEGQAPQDYPESLEPGKQQGKKSLLSATAKCFLDSSESQ